jgi:deoxyribose-phosphate aldolase
MTKHLPPQELVTLAQELVIESNWDTPVLHDKVVRATQLLLPLIDHTVLKPEASISDIRKVCAEAKQYPFASVCVHPYWIPVVTAELTNSNRGICSVIGFPSGIHSSLAKQREAEYAVEAGANELDMVWNLGAVKSGEWEAVVNDMYSVLNAAGDAAIVKVILESGVLTEQELRHGCELALRAGATFVKTSTGFHASGGATVQAVKTMREVVGTEMGVKASGGIRDLRTSLQMVLAGANRIGTSSGVTIATNL